MLIEKIQIQVVKRKKHVARRKVCCRCTSRDALNFPSLGPPCLQTLPLCSFRTFLSMLFLLTLVRYKVHHLWSPIYYIFVQQDNSTTPETLCEKKYSLCGHQSWTSVAAPKTSTDINEKNTQFWNSSSIYKTTAPPGFEVFPSCSL